MSYSQPDQFLDSKEIREAPAIRSELAKTLALSNLIYEDDKVTELPFVHHLDDIKVWQAEERALQEDLSLVSVLGDMEKLGLELAEKDFVP
jgi:hypothetical protein